MAVIFMRSNSLSEIKTSKVIHITQENLNFLLSVHQISCEKKDKFEQKHTNTKKNKQTNETRGTQSSHKQLNR